MGTIVLERVLTLYRLSKLVTASLDVDSTLSAIVDAAHELVAADSTALLLEDGCHLTIRHGRGAVASAIGEQVPRGAGVAGKALGERRSVLIDDMLAEHGRARPDLDSVSGIRSYLAVPLVWRGETLGLVTVGRTAAGAFHTDDVELIGELAEQAAAAVAHARAYEQEQARRVELEAANLALERAHQHLAQGEKLTAIGLLAHGIAHELNTPLGVVLANLFVLTEYGQKLGGVALAARSAAERISAGESALAVAAALGGVVGAADLEYMLDDLPSLLTESTASANRMAAIVRSVATFAQGSSGPSSPVSVEESLEAAITLSWSELKQHGELVREYAGVAAVLGKVSELTELFVHVLLNAAYFSEGKDGSITVRTSCEAGMVAVHILDSGRGIEADHLARVFEPFFTTKPLLDGSGLGLAVCHGIAHRHGGTIQVQSPGAGQGTTVTVRLPLASMPPAST